MHHVISFAAIYEKPKFKIALGSKWNTGRPETSPASNTINYTNLYNPTIDYNAPNNKTLAEFFQVNLSATYKWEMPKITYKLGVSVLNILDKKNELNEYYKINTSNNFIEDVYFYGIQRTPNLSFRVEF